MLQWIPIQVRDIQSNHGGNQMQFCEHCRITIKGSKNACPLCGGILQGQGEKNEDTFPHIPTIYQEFNILIRAMILISITTIVVCFAINAITGGTRWSLIVAAGVCCTWLSLFFVIRKRNNIPKSIVWQVVIISILAVLWDRSMGWGAWSINYVIPIMCVVAMIVMAIAANILKISVRDYIVYFLVDALFGFIPVIFIIFGWLDVIYPSVICVAASVISISALLLFEGENIKAELNKRMHV